MHDTNHKGSFGRRQVLGAAAAAITAIGSRVASSHSIQGFAGEGAEFLLVFNQGNFNENATFLVTDFLAHIPKPVLAKNFGVPESAFANIPKEELYTSQSTVPGPLGADRVAAAAPAPIRYSHRLMEQEPIRSRAGTVRIVDSSNFSAAKMIAAGLIEVEPGGMRTALAPEFG
jgi:oxalate decarboxylase